MVKRMNTEEAKREVYQRFKDELQPDKKKKGYICPICNNGRGNDGDGMTENPRSPFHYSCWKCGIRNEDAFDFIARKQNLPIGSGEAMKAAYQQYGIEIEYNAPDTQEVHNTQEEQYAQEEKRKDFTEYFKRMAANIDSAAAKQYLSFRGISTETAKRFMLGFDAGWRSPTAIERGKNPPASPRLIIPTSNEGYIARDTRPEVKDYAKMKEGPSRLFNLRSLYNTEGRACFVVEGELDAISIEEVGGRACALGSTSNVKLFLSALKEKPTGNTLLLALDNDVAGQRAADELSKGLQAQKVNFAPVEICGTYNDENEHLQANREAFAQAVKKAEDAQKPAAKMMQSFLQAVQSRQYEPLPTGIKALDDLIGGGFIRQTLIMLGAAPGMGKSYFAQQLFETMAQEGHNCLYFNLEMSRQQLIARSISRLARQRENAKITALDVLQGYRWTTYQKRIIERTAGVYAEEIGPHMLYNPAGSTAQLDSILQQMEEAAQRAKNTGKEAPFIVLDYLHLLRGNAREDVQTTVKRAVEAFKDYAIKYNTVVFVILAFNRESNKGGKVSQESGRDSSSIEYSADLMLGLNYTKVEESASAEDAEKARAQVQKDSGKGNEIAYKLKVLKNRLQGGCGSIDLKFHGKYGLFFPAKDEQSGMERTDEDLQFDYTGSAERI